MLSGKAVFRHCYMSVSSNLTIVVKSITLYVFRLHHALLMFIMQQGMDSYMEIENTIPELPGEIMVKHAAEVWKCIWTRYTTPVEVN